MSSSNLDYLLVQRAREWNHKFSNVGFKFIKWSIAISIDKSNHLTSGKWKMNHGQSIYPGIDYDERINQNDWICSPHDIVLQLLIKRFNDAIFAYF